MNLRNIAILLAALGMAAAAEAQSSYRRSAPRSLVSDLIASDVGDILTVVISEISSVKNEDKVDRQNTTSLQARLEAYRKLSQMLSWLAVPLTDPTWQPGGRNRP